MTGFKVALCATTALAIQLAGSPSAIAQTSSVTPVPEPVVGAVPSAPSGATESFDKVAITQLMKVVELARLIGGGISQLLTEVGSQKQALDLIRSAQTGTKSFPVLNGPVEMAEREGGAGLRELAADVLNGNASAPTDMQNAITSFRDLYALAPILGLKDDPSLSKALLAQASAQALVAASTADVTYKRANTSMSRLNDYISAVENSADLKTSMDINTRVMIEISQQINELLRVQAATASVGSSYIMSIGGEMGAGDTFLDELLK